MRTSLFKPLFITTLLCSLLSRQLAAQHVLDDRIDSLQKLVTKAAPDTGKITLYSELAGNYLYRYLLMGNQPADSIAFFQTTTACQQLSKQLNDAYGMGYSLIQEARLYRILNNLPVYNERWQKAYSMVKTANNKAGLGYAYLCKADYLPFSDSSLKIGLYDSAIQMGRQAGKPKLEAVALKTLANLHLQLGKYPLATRQLMQALDIQEKAGDNRIHYTTDLLSHIYLATGNHKEALRYALASINYSRKFTDTIVIATFYQRIANVYAALGSYEKAYHYFEKVLSAATPSKTNRAVAIGLINSMTTCLLSLRKYQEALDFLSQKLQAFPPIDVNTQKMADRLYLSLYCDLGRFKEAEKCFQKILKPSTDFNFDAQDQVGFLLKGAQLYYHLKQYDRAEYYADSAYRFARHLKAWRATMEASYQLYELDLAKNNHPSAIRHLKEFEKYSDSVQKERSNRRAIESVIQYETDLKNSELNFLNNKAQLQQKIMQQGQLARNAMITGAGLLLLLLLLIFSRYRVRQKANKALQEKQAAINRQNRQLEEMVQEEKKITAEKDSLLKEKDRLLTEKEWLMKEINHRVKNNLEVVMRLLNAQGNSLKDSKALDVIEETRNRVQAISLIHRKLYHTDPEHPVIDMAGYIQEIIEHLAGSLDPHHRIFFNLSVDPVELDVAQAVPIGLIINEAVTNAVKYAFPGGNKGAITLSLLRDPAGGVELTISDNGIGFPENVDWQQSGSLGMSLMQGLSQQLNGRLQVLSASGVTIKISFEPGKSTLNTPAP